MARHLWSGQVQPKIRLFMWRACLDILPTRTKLFDKGFLYSFSCQWCEVWKHHRMFSGSVSLRKRFGKLAQFLSQILAVIICSFGTLLLTALMCLKLPRLQSCLLLPERFGMLEIGFYGIIKSAQWMMFGGKRRAWLPIF